MCLGIPGRVQTWIERDPLFAQAMVEFDGVAHVCHMACVPEAEVGDYVIVHAGVAIARVDQQAADRVLYELRRLGLVDIEQATAVHEYPEPYGRDENRL